MQFRLLGPVEVHGRSGQVMTMPRRLERRLLAILLLEAGRTVPMDRLYDLLWEERLPAAPRRVVHTYVSRIRAVLAEAGAAEYGVALVADQGGYTLRVAPELVDAHRFRALLDQAGRTSDLTERDRLLAQARACWRGPALAGAATDRLRQRLCADLEELRQHAVEESLATGLELGRHQELLPELAKLVVEYPQRQRLAELNILALYRAGRTSEALEVYADVRARLADELGLDPSPTLQRLHQAMLRGETVPAAHTTREPSPGNAVTPAHLPADLAAFAGRDEQLRLLDALLRRRTSTAVVISAIAGTAGVGKTTLAVHWAHTARERFPDGQLYANLRGFDPHDNAATPAEVVRRFLDALQVPAARVPADFGAQVDLYRSVLAGKRVLLVLDNARDPDQVRPLLPGTPGCLTLVTSRNHLTGLVAIDGAHHLALDLLSTEEAGQLLEARLGSGRLTHEPRAVEELITLCARLPLALAIAAAHVATRPQLSLAGFVRELRESRHRLDTLSGDDAATDIRAVFACSYHALSSGGARLFRLLGLHPGPDISAAAAASLAGIALPEVGPLLSELGRAHLVAEHVAGRYILHDLLREYAAERALEDDSDEDRDHAVRRVLDHYLYTACRCALLLAPRRTPISPAPPLPRVTPEKPVDEAAAWAWFTAEHAVLIAAVARAAGTGFDAHVWQLAWALADFLDRRGHWLDRVKVQLAALWAAERLGDLRAQARSHRGLAIVYGRQDRLVEAREHLLQALRLSTALDDPLGQANSHRGLASMAERQGHHELSLDHAQQALDLFRAVGDRPGEAQALNTVGWNHAQIGDYPQSLRLCEHALGLLRELGDRFGQAATLDSLGYVHYQLGQFERAASCYRQSTQLCRELGDRHYQAETLIRLGEAHQAAGDPGAAGVAWQQALDILSDLRHPRAADLRARIADSGPGPDAGRPGSAGSTH